MDTASVLMEVLKTAPGRWYELGEVVDAIKKSWPKTYIVPCYEAALGLGSL
jgi:indolepyruvate ferredoxin oxidoreductase beta subunit